MTICIGILATDGIVIAADAQETDTYFKRSTQKIMTWRTAQNADGIPSIPAACVIAGAGDGGFADAFTAEFIDGIRGEMTIADFESYASEKAETFYRVHVRPLLGIDRNFDFSVLVGAYFQHVTRLYKTYRTSFQRVYAPTAAIGIGQEFALRELEEYPIADVRHVEIEAAAVIQKTKDCIEGCGKFTDIVSLRNPIIVPDEVHGSRLETHPDFLTLVPPKKIAGWEASFSETWRLRQRKLYFDLIEEELKRSDSQT